MSSRIPSHRSEGARPSSLAVRILLLAIAVLGTACARLVPFTHELRVEHSLKPDDLKNLQFYTSHKITLRREVDSGSRQVTGGHKLLLVSGKTIEEVVIPEGTPGVAVAIGETSLAVSFEPGTSMIFSVQGSSPSSAVARFAEPPDPFPGNARPEPPPPTLDRFGGLWSGSYFLTVDPGGRVPFRGTVFQAEDDASHAHLLIDAELLEAVVKRQKVLPGIRL
jgi:hypothetical protein